jgi:hypothetical protein
LYIAKEIIAIGINESTATGKFIGDAGAGYCSETNAEEIESYLVERVVKKVKRKDRRNDNIIHFFELKTQAGKFINYLVQ